MRFLIVLVACSLVSAKNYNRTELYEGTKPGVLCASEGKPVLRISGKFFAKKQARKRILRIRSVKKRTSLRRALKSLKPAHCPKRTRDFQFTKVSFEGKEGTSVTLTGLTDDSQVALSVVEQPKLGDLFVENARLIWRVGNHAGSSEEAKIRGAKDGVTRDVSITLRAIEGGDFTGKRGSLKPYLTNSGTLSEIEARRFAANVLFGGSSEIVEELQTEGGLARVVDLLLKGSTVGSCNQGAVDLLALEAADYRKGGACTGQSNELCQLKALDWREGVQGEQHTSESLSSFILVNATKGCNPLKERMVLFWMDHFNVSSTPCNNDFGCGHKLMPHFKLYRDHVFNFNSLLKAMNSDYLMLAWLDNIINEKRWSNGGVDLSKINENYGREIMELYTIGTNPVLNPELGFNYSDSHVARISEALAGWESRDDGFRNVQLYSCDCNQNCIGSTCDKVCRAHCPAGKGVIVNRGTFPMTFKSAYFNDRKWMPGANNSLNLTPITLFEGTPLEQTQVFRSSDKRDRSEVPQELIRDSVAEFLLSHPETARFIAARLYSTFVKIEFDEKDRDNIEHLANLLGDLRDIRSALKMILLSESMFSKESFGVRSPVESVVTVVRALDLPLSWDKFNGQHHMDSYQLLRDRLVKMFHEPARPTSVFGSAPHRGAIQGGSPLSGISSLGTSPLIARYNTQNYLSNWIDSVKSQLNFNWNTFLGAEPQNSRKIVSSLATRLGIPLSEEELATLDKYMNSSVVAEGAAPQPNAWNPNNQNMVNTKIPGLIMILVLSPGFITL